jgi:hypothetical protein
MKQELNPDHPCHPWSKQQPNQNERKVMNEKFDELAKGMAQSVTRRGALKKFGLGLAGIVLASLGLASQAHAAKGGAKRFHCRCAEYAYGCARYSPDSFFDCVDVCNVRCFG